MDPVSCLLSPVLWIRIPSFWEAGSRSSSMWKLDFELNQGEKLDPDPYQSCWKP
jgi:hypothetical protein